VVLLSVVLGATVLREPVAWAAATLNVQIVGPLDADGNVEVREQGTVTVAGSVAVTNDPPTGVVLRDPLSGDRVTPESPVAYTWDTSKLSAVRFGFQSLSGSENCRVRVITGGILLKEWNLSGQFQEVGDVFDVPGPNTTVFVNTTNICFALVHAYGLPIG